MDLWFLKRGLLLIVVQCLLVVLRLHNQLSDMLLLELFKFSLVKVLITLRILIEIRARYTKMPQSSDILR